MIYLNIVLIIILLFILLVTPILITKKKEMFSLRNKLKPYPNEISLIQFPTEAPSTMTPPTTTTQNSTTSTLQNSTTSTNLNTIKETYKNSLKECDNIICNSVYSDEQRKQGQNCYYMVNNDLNWTNKTDDECKKWAENFKKQFKTSQFYSGECPDIITTITKKATCIPQTVKSQSVIKQKCYGQGGKCKDGYQLKIPDNEVKNWACGKNCSGGQFQTDSSCNCACIENEKCLS